jgi:hypothetical protein
MDTIKIVASDYVGFEVGSSNEMKFEYNDSPLKVTINSILLFTSKFFKFF